MQRFHVQGYGGTSLADGARTAALSPGNVFYYFRTKEDLARAVIEAWHRELVEHLATLVDGDDGWSRLERFVMEAAERRQGYASLGCPLAGLARDLRRGSDALGA